MHRAASVFFILPVCERLFECGISALDVDHVEANRSVTKFFIESVDSILIARKVNFSLMVHLFSLFYNASNAIKSVCVERYVHCSHGCFVLGCYGF